MTNPVYHEGELRVQARAGVADQAARIGRGIRDELPAAAAEFLDERRFVVVARADGDGRAWASILVGAPGFVHVTGPRAVTIEARPDRDDPLAGVWEAPGALGLLAIDFAGRRRMRVNGEARPTERGVELVADQVYSNCPKYIQAREVASAVAAPEAASVGTSLTPAQIALVEGADTMFVASYDETGGADASHRGGRPGFVRVASPTSLSWPDYPGNTMFQTFGNLDANGRIGLLFVDFDTGTAMHLTGSARIAWGDERVVEMTVERVVERRGAVALAWRFIGASPFNP